MEWGGGDGGPSFRRFGFLRRSVGTLVDFSTMVLSVLLGWFYFAKEKEDEW